MLELLPHPALVLVEWVDTTNIAAWTALADVPAWAADGGFVCRNVGYLVHEDIECVVLAARVALNAEPPQVGLYERIPKGTIRGRWTLTDPLAPVVPPGCVPACNGTWPGPEPRRPFHVKGCPNDAGNICQSNPRA